MRQMRHYKKGCLGFLEIGWIYWFRAGIATLRMESLKFHQF